MSIYLYSIRAKTVTVNPPGGPIRAHTLEMLHTNWEGMITDSGYGHDNNIPRSHALKQGAALKYWEAKGLPEFVIHGSDVYRWTGKTPFWVDTDLVPGSFIGSIEGGRFVQHVCETRMLSRRGTLNVVVCGHGRCLRQLEARPGEVDALVAQREQKRAEGAADAAKVRAIWESAKKQRVYRDRLDYDVRRASELVGYTRERITRLREQLAADEALLIKQQVGEAEAQYAARKAEETLANLEKVAKAEQTRLDNTVTLRNCDGVTTVEKREPATDC